MTTENRHRLQCAFIDYVTTSVAWLLFNIGRYFSLDEVNSTNSLSGYLFFFMVLVGQAVIPVVMLLIYWLSGYYKVPFSTSRVDIVFSTAGSVTIGSLLIYFVAIIDDPIPDRISNYVLLIILLGLLLFFVLTGRLLMFKRFKRRVARGIVSWPVVVVGDKVSVANSLKRMQSKDYIDGLKPVVVSYIDSDSDRAGKLPAVSFDRLPAECDRLGVKQIVLALGDGNRHRLQDVVVRLYSLNRPVLLPAKSAVGGLASVKVRNVAGYPYTDIASVEITGSYTNVKRVMDVSLSALALLTLSPFMALVAFMVKRDSRGPVFYKQERVGLNNRKFMIYKFRTMYTDAESAGPALSSDNDPRITHLGHFLRKYRIDELPQFWNVIKGDMSLVGPRPERPYYEEQILARVPRYALVHRMRPGITSWGMVKYGYANTIDSMVERLAYDMIYLENVSISVDLKIIFFTVRTVLTGKGV